MSSSSRAIAIRNTEALMSSSWSCTSTLTTSKSAQFYCQPSTSSASSVQTSFSAGSSIRRPLPAPPMSAPPPRTSSRSLRPLPNPPRSESLPKVPPRSSSLKARPSNRTAVTYSAHPSKHPMSPAPKKSLHINIPPPSSGIAKIAYDSPLSPITFAIPGSDGLRRRREDALTRHMKDLGFVEETPPPVPEKDRHVVRNPVTPPAPPTEIRDVVYLVEDRSSSDRARSGTTKQPPPVSMKLVVDLPPDDKRWSRKWVREYNGKRLVEEDYQTILHSLRKLR